MPTALKPFQPICDAIALLLAPHAEVVLHDLKSGRIAYIANAYSRRRQGDLSLNDEDGLADLSVDIIGPYPKTNWDGRRLRSITSVLRDGRDKPIGLLCINHDLEPFARALDQLSALVTLPKREPQPALLFSGDWREGVNEIVGVFLTQRGTTLAGLTTEETDELIAMLDTRGLFSIRNGIAYMTTLLDCSRATIYNRLKATRLAQRPSKTPTRRPSKPRPRTKQAI
ncbi:helix-turn-helix transcriptional regulator [Dyella silvatica]|uniref:helix-turn-helix transcriptional regulator n=1 Tax=Dyella silvatica TaxID=2992128 RepID=UPI00224F1331|nr:PAS domain-containing protein [Dyella silvatica]